jgi:hypothetical protein
MTRTLRTFTIDPAEDAELTTRAREAGTTVSEYIAQALRASGVLTTPTPATRMLARWPHDAPPEQVDTAIWHRVLGYPGPRSMAAAIRATYPHALRLSAGVYLLPGRVEVEP